MAPDIIWTMNSMTTYCTLLQDMKIAASDRDMAKHDCLLEVISLVEDLASSVGSEVTDNLCMTVLKLMAKRCSQSVENFKLDKREDLALKKMEQLKFILRYLPKMYSEEQVLIIVLGTLSANRLEEVKLNASRVLELISQRDDADLIDANYAAQYLRLVLR